MRRWVGNTDRHRPMDIFAIKKDKTELLVASWA